MEHLKIIAVEDEESLRKLTVRILQNAGHTAFPASNVDEALGLLLEHTDTDVIITDGHMEGKSGVDLLIILRREYQDVPIILYSGNTRDWLDRLPEGVCFSAVLQKPASVEELLKTVQQVTEQLEEV